MHETTNGASILLKTAYVRGTRVVLLDRFTGFNRYAVAKQREGGGAFLHRDSYFYDNLAKAAEGFEATASMFMERTDNDAISYIFDHWVKTGEALCLVDIADLTGQTNQQVADTMRDLMMRNPNCIRSVPQYRSNSGTCEAWAYKPCEDLIRWFILKA